MPYEIIDEGDGLHARLYGFVAPFELMECNREVAEHPDWVRHRYHIFDHTEMDSDSVWAFPDVTSDAIADEDRALYADRMNLTRVALVAKSQKMREIFKDYAARNPLPPHTTLGIFSTLESARQWIRDSRDAGETPVDADRAASAGGS
ncbi:MAG: hypothetical protein CMM61_08740 [Rhodospirillaceae bacterium]|nr:hypothetical protein [Rhodospirillaceae bacterium]